MRLATILLVLASCSWLTAGDVAHLKAAKARLVGHLAGKHHKRGIYSAVPPFKLGHDIPHVTHSLVKPLVVTYPPTATVAAVKVPLSPPFGPRFPLTIGNRVPFPHGHFGHKFPHHTKTVLIPKPDSHFHHHHHVEPKPLVPVLPAPPIVHATPFVPVAQPSGVNVVHPVPAPSPPVVVQSAAAVPEPVVHPQPFPLAPPPLHFLRPQHLPLRPLAPIAPIQPAHAIQAPVFPLTPQYVIRPGNAVQTSYFATYPRYPLVNYQSPLLPIPPAAQSFDQLLFNRPQVLLPQAHDHGVIDHHPSVVVGSTPTLLHPTQAAFPQPAVHLEPAQPTVHLQPTQPTVHLQPQPTVHVQPTLSAVPLDHDGWSPVPAQHDFNPVQQPEGHFPHSINTHHFTQEQGTQVFEHHTGNEQQFHDQQFHDQQFHDQQVHDQQVHDQQVHDQQLHDYHNQLQHHIQHQLDQTQYEQHLNNQHQLNQEYGAPQQNYQPGHDFSQQNQDFAKHAHEYAHHVQEYAQHGQEYAQTNEYNLQQQQPTQEYGVPQQLEGRSAEGDGDGETQRFHNHIPLGLQPPIDRPLEHFR